MKRFHVHVAVEDLSKSIAFYSAMFGAEPSVTKADYAKWMLEDPRVNFAISDRGQAPGVNHLGLQAEDDAELEAIHANLQNADTAVAPQMGRTAATRSPTSTGSPIRRASPGRAFAPLSLFRSSAPITPNRQARRQAPAAAAMPWQHRRVVHPLPLASLPRAKQKRAAAAKHAYLHGNGR